MLWDLVRTGAAAMMIQCPNCGFIGGVPGHVTARHRNARCPKCQFRFGLTANLERPALALPALPGPLPHAALAVVSDEEQNPGSSFYVLQAITEENWEPARAEGSSGIREVEHPEQSNRDSSAPAALGDAPLSDPAAAGAGARAVAPARTRDPWYARVLQGWGVVLLVWAGLLLFRNLSRILAGAGDSARDAELIPTVLAVLLLVPSAAGLFLLVDLGRFIRGMRPLGSNLPSPPEVPSGSAVRLVPRRFWRHRTGAFRFFLARLG
jgi:hypothetical protein